MYNLKLSDVCKIVRGERITKTQLDPNGTYDVWSGGVTPMGKFGKYNREPNVTTVAQYGSAGYVEWHDKKFWANDVCYTLYPCNNVIGKYLYYAVKNQEELLYKLRTDAVPACLPLDVLQSIPIPVPPLPVQEEIVRILDKFTELESELAQELAQELAHRKQQYAFYCDRLLSFESSIKMRTVKQLIDEQLINIITPSFKIKKNDYCESGLVPVISQESEYISGYFDKKDSKITKRNYVCFGDHS